MVRTARMRAIRESPLQISGRCVHTVGRRLSPAATVSRYSNRGLGFIRRLRHTGRCAFFVRSCFSPTAASKLQNRISAKGVPKFKNATLYG